jgi:predicted nucleotidyltransferase
MLDALRSGLASEPRVAHALLFGSHARTAANPDSDVDLAIAPGERLEWVARRAGA